MKFFNYFIFSVSREYLLKFSCKFDDKILKLAVLLYSRDEEAGSGSVSGSASKPITQIIQDSSLGAI